MPKRKGALPRTNDTAVKMDADVVRKAKIAAAYRGQSLAEFLSVELGAIIDRVLAEEHAKEMGEGRKSQSRATKGEKT